MKHKQKSQKPRPAIIRNQPIGVGEKNARKYLVKEEKLDSENKLVRRIMERPTGGSPFNPQTKINAYNFPFTFSSGSGCFYQCNYCFLRQPFFQRHVTADHGKEMNFLPGTAEATKIFVKRQQDRGLPQYMKRVQMGITTEMWMPQMLAYTKPEEMLKVFRDKGQDWMLHLVTKSPAILKYADLLAEMKNQVQVEVSFVTLDEDASRIFETGTPSVRKRLEIVEKLAAKGIFVRMMMMPVMREYDLMVVGKTRSREIVFGNPDTGERRAGRKRQDRVDGNFAAGEVQIELHDGKRWLPADPGEVWKPSVVKDWSKIKEAQKNWRNWGAQAYKQKDLNYFYVDELIRAHNQKRAPISERGRSEDPTVEELTHSGETVRDKDGKDAMVDVQAWHLKRKDWGGPEPPLIRRRKMDFGYRSISSIDWVDCQ